MILASRSYDYLNQKIKPVFKSWDQIMWLIINRVHIGFYIFILYLSSVMDFHAFLKLKTRAASCITD